ncbi:phosphate ABC transporter permease subunit PstC [Bartonella henselae]|uniref:Phosphate transport system permease protein n=1 Tax=Bartonella henselae (strain ATCC 49882 / DSM 28221 / CCUG 30454 / Houston 1) TaxID=283166 RepID=A0A0H3M253_BARHE|nr:phosphate ABC transporter permease subunit PstC [Bartonella henselae]ATP11878.1 phosphate ABC transporter permease subunit PstC [Bartonella henselae]ETS07606.1 phosphate ABC transporter, permease PstC [Bartonella henselae JK 42]ETS16409.1 phosphate ABC transporter, permease PstC [Bartonella henselae JK 41]KEC57731.1 phosphate ABC transporter, permease PstC [Bartonella henselae str. Zeus]KEC62947.1 phosphate ABC transporter, permease PstC [Bartonella henselae JK 53]
MRISFLISLLLIFACIGFCISYIRARTLEYTQYKMHSRTYYYGWWTFLITVFPALIFLIFWDGGSAIYLEYSASQEIEACSTHVKELVNHDLILGIVRSLVKRLPYFEGDLTTASYEEVQAQLLAKGFVFPHEVSDDVLRIAQSWVNSSEKLQFIGHGVLFVIASCGFICGIMQVSPRQRARNKVECLIVIGLICASIVAVLTTAAIALSMFFQTMSFFQSVPFSNFFLGTVWDPRFSASGAEGEVGQFGLIPLLAGTLYIAFVAMLFAVPIGLFSALYMAEYASARLRSIVKPLLEVLAGIPTIVYGFFALKFVGPFLRDLSVSLSGGVGFIMAQSVLTAGVVMGIMLIPFVSSLSDDVITAVPRILREGSYGLGATQSETIKKVVIPAALPGIMGAILLTASRAIGETMIVVLAAGVAANLTLNPFEAMTTITVKIVNQLTGDFEFNSPQTLVSFALGMTLFIMTLLMNILALYIVRKYREQYE